MLAEPSLYFSWHNYSFMTTSVPECHQNPRLQAKFETYVLNNFNTLPAIYFNLLQFLKCLLLHFVIFKWWLVYDDQIWCPNCVFYKIRIGHHLSFIDYKLIIHLSVYQLTWDNFYTDCISFWLCNCTCCKGLQLHSTLWVVGSNHAFAILKLNLC